MAEMDIVRAHYLGKSKVVICKFAHYKLKDKIFTASYGRPFGVKVKEDYSKKTRRVRGLLGEKFRELRGMALKTQGSPPKLVAENLFYRGEKWTINEAKQMFEHVDRNGRVSFTPLHGRRPGTGEEEERGGEGGRAENVHRPPEEKEKEEEMELGGEEKQPDCDAQSQAGGEDAAAEKEESTGDGGRGEARAEGAEGGEDGCRTPQRREEEKWRSVTSNKKRSAEEIRSPGDKSPSTATAKLKQFRYEERSVNKS